MAGKKRRRVKRVKKRKQKVGFLNRYDFAYAGKDTINQAFKNLNNTAPGLINNLSNGLNKITKQRARQLIDQGEETLQKVGPKLIRDAIEDVYQTPAG